MSPLPPGKVINLSKDMHAIRDGYIPRLEVKVERNGDVKVYVSGQTFHVLMGAGDYFRFEVNVVPRDPAKPDGLFYVDSCLVKPE